MADDESPGCVDPGRGSMDLTSKDTDPAHRPIILLTSSAGKTRARVRGREGEERRGVVEVVVRGGLVWHPAGHRHR